VAGAKKPILCLVLMHRLATPYLPPGGGDYKGSLVCNIPKEYY